MARLSLYLLGSPRVEVDGHPIKVDTRKAIALLTYIAITGQSHQRDSLVNLLWPEFDHTRGRASLRRNLYALNKALIDDFLAVDRETVGLNPNADIWLDLDQFHSHLNECLTHGHTASDVCLACISPLAAAVQLYRGDFLAGFSLKDSYSFDDWQFFQADAVRCEVSSALDRLVKCHIAQGAFDDAIAFAREWLALDRLNEYAHCQLMLLYVWSDQRSAALRQYQECVKILKEELDAPPQAGTTALHQTILQGSAPGPPVREDWANGQFAVGSAAESTVSLVRPSLAPTSAERRAFVARERELARLHGYLDAALAGRGGVVFVTGGAGRGKTALVQEFARQAQDNSTDLVFASGNCNAHTGSGDPYLPFREVLALLTGDIDALWAAGAITRQRARSLWENFPHVVQALLDFGPDLIDTFIHGTALMRRATAYLSSGIVRQPAWQGRLQMIVERNAAAPRNLALEQSALFEQYARVMEAMARDRPLLMVIDDLQWADVGSIGLLFHLGRGVTLTRMLIICAYRAEDVALGRPLSFRRTPVSAGMRERERHPLEPVLHELQRAYGDIVIDLAQAEDRRFVDEYLDAEPNLLSPRFRQTLYRQTRGHPLFTIELLSGMQERGDLVRDNEGRWIEGAALDWETLPARVEAVIEERIDRLDSPSREVLRVASVEGETFTAEVAARVQSTDEREIVACLSGELEKRHRLVRAQEIQRLGARRLSRYRFRHSLYQNYLYHTLDPVERAHLHESVGLALEALYADATGDIAVTLARHFEEAGILEKALDYLHQAGNRAARMSANEAAVDHLSKALKILETMPASARRIQQELELQIALGVPLVLTRGHAAPEVEGAYARARSLSSHLGDTPQLFQVLLGLRRFYLHRGELVTACELGEQLIALAHNLKDASDVSYLPHLSRAHMMHAETLYCLGEFGDARDQCQRGLSVHDPRQRDAHLFLYGNDTEVGLRIFEALALWHLGFPDRALSKADGMLALAEELAHPFTRVFALYFAGTLSQFCWHVRTARQRAEEVLRISEKQGFALYKAWGAVLRGWALAEGGSAELGIAQMQKGIAALQALGVTRTQPHSLALVARAYEASGLADKGLDLLTEALALVEVTGERTVEAELYRLRGELLRTADWREAESCFRRAVDVARRQNAKSWELRATMSLSRLWHQQGKTAKARVQLQEVYESFDEGYGTADLIEARALLAEIG